MIAVYDGSFENYLTLVYDVYYKKITPKKILRVMPQTLLLDEIYLCEYNQDSSMRVYEALKEKFEKKSFETILNVFMCDNAEFEMALLEYITLGFKNQKELQNINNSSIFRVQNLQKELFRNLHKMSGFLRFEELEDGSLYARVESKFNLVYFLGQHFAKRFNNQLYYIHDIKRALVFVHSKDFRGVKEVAAFDLPKLSEDEVKFKKLWKTFFQSVAIESRKNEKLQQSLTPLLYRRYMSEFIN